MKSVRQFIIEEPTSPRSRDQILRDIKKRLQAGRLQSKFKSKFPGPGISPKDLDRIANAEADAEFENTVRDSRGKSGERARKDVVKTQGQDDLIKKISKNRTRTFDPKGDKGKFFGKPTEVDINQGKAKYVPPKDVDPSEFEGGRRRARRRYDPDFEKVQSNINRKEKLKQKFKQFEYDPDSKGGDPAPKKKKTKTETGRSAKRRKPSKSVEQLKKEIEARTTKVKGSTIKGTKPPVLPKPTSVPGGGTAHTNPQSMLSIPRKSTPKFDKSYNKKSPDSSNPNRIDQRDVSKRASDFTKDTNTERIKKLSKGRVKIDYGMPKPEKGTVLRKVDSPKVKTQLSPDTLRSTNAKSSINTTWDKSKASRTFKDMATDSRKKLSSKGPIGRSKEYVKNLTNKIKSSLGFKTKVKSTPKVTKIPKNKLFQKLNITRKKGLRTFKGTGPGLYFGLDNYTKQREAGAGRLRSTGGAVTSAAVAGQTWKAIGNVFKPSGSPKATLARGALTLGAQIFGAKKAAELTQQAYDSTLGPPKTKTKTVVNTKNNKGIIPFGGSKKKKKLDFGNYSFSFAGDSRLNKKDKK